MVHRVTWNPHALRSLDRLEDFLREKSPRAGTRAVLTIIGAARTLADFPHAGRLADDLHPDERELLVAFGTSGYVIAYRLRENWVEILDVRHQREAGY